MATFVLVHGAWHGGWCWRDVATELASAGHAVFTPTSSGLAERAHLAGEATLAGHVDELAKLLYFADLREVVLVGHSYGGMVITGAAAQVHARIARLVYLDAFVPDQDGQSFFDLLVPARRKAYDDATSGGVVVPPDPEIFGVPREQAAWVGDRLTPHPARTLSDGLSVPVFPPLARSYVRCTQGPLTASFSGFATRLRDTAGWDVVDFDSGHDAMITRPLDLAALLAT